MNYSVFSHGQRGQLLIELLVALGVAAVLLPALATGLVASREGKSQQRQRLDAVALVREAEEAVRVVREAGWSGISTNGMYHPVVAGGTWALGSGSEIVNGLTRTVTISDVYRSASGDIVSGAGTLDPSTKKISVIASWGIFGLSNVTSTLYLTRYLNNQVWTQTTQADFDAGTKTNVTTTNTAGGEVTLTAGGRADWCAPNLSIQAVDLPKSGVANAITAIEGRVFAGTGDNASGVSFANVTIGNTDPPTAIVAGTFDGFKTNGIFGETNYAYLATDNNFKEIEIINLTTNPYSEAGWFNAPGNGNGNSIYVVGNIGYMTSASTLYTFDLTSKAGARLQLGSVELAGTGKKIAVVGGYAYVIIDSATTQLQIVNVQDPASLSVVGSAQLPAGEGVDVFVNQTGTRAYVATEASSSQREFFIVDVTTKTGVHTALGSYEANGTNPKGVTVVPGSRALLVGTGGSQQYQVIDISSETNPVHCTSDGRSGGLAIATGVHGISSVLEQDGDAYSYIITGDASSELKIIEGGPGGKFATNGTFESSTFDAGGEAAFNRFVVGGNIPVDTSLQYQLAVAHGIGSSCSGVAFSFVGPDGTAGTKFATGGAIPVSSDNVGFENPGRCFRYKVFLSATDPIASPVFTDMTVNYSP